MPGFLDTVQEFYSTTNLYEVLGVNKTANDKELKRAYHRLSLKVHPDRVEQEEVAEATRKFQVLGKIYSILSDEDKRAIYDEDGTVDEEDESIMHQERNWEEYWRLLFRVTPQSIQEFSDKYKGSEEEVSDLKTAYLKHEGDMDSIMDEIMLAEKDDEPRFTDILNTLVKDGEVPVYEKFVGESKAKKMKRKRKFDREAAEVAQMKVTDKGEGSLKQLIEARQKTREQEMGSFFDQLEQKYAKKPRKSGSSGRAHSKKKVNHKKNT